MRIGLAPSDQYKVRGELEPWPIRQSHMDGAKNGLGRSCKFGDDDPTVQFTRGRGRPSLCPAFMVEAYS